MECCRTGEEGVGAGDTAAGAGAAKAGRAGGAGNAWAKGVVSLAREESLLASLPREDRRPLLQVVVLGVWSSM